VPAAGGARGRSLTIGEAVARLAPDFPGIRPETLRALEQHGLVVPERNSAGYRRYTERDLDAARRALAAPQPRTERPAADARSNATANAVRTAHTSSAVTARTDADRPPQRGYAAVSTPTATSAATTASTSGARTASTVPAASAASTTPASERAARPESADQPAAEAAAPENSQSTARRRAGRWPEPEYFTPELGEVALGREGLARAAGLADEWVAELVSHSLLSGRDPASGADLLVARAAAELLGYGIEPRHLRPVGVAADRAAALIRAAQGGSSRSGTAQAAAALVRLEAALLRAALLDD